MKLDVGIKRAIRNGVMDETWITLDSGEQIFARYLRYDENKDLLVIHTSEAKMVIVKPIKVVGMRH